MDKGNGERRWDTDEIGQGFASGTAFAPGVEALLNALHSPAWVAEEPDTHLLPHLRRVCEATDSPWRLMTTECINTVYVVSLEWVRANGNFARLRADIFSLAGAIAEGATYVLQQITQDAITYEVVTGLLDEQTHFRSHGHLVRFRVMGDTAASLLTSWNI